MTLELLLVICSLCTIAGFFTLWLDTQETNEDVPEMLFEMDYDPSDEEICRICGVPCDDYEHWTQGG